MIAFDNGPAHGDYVRYIDDLMKRGAIAETAAVLRAADPSVTPGQTRDRLAALAAGRATGDTSAWDRQLAAQNATRGTGFATLAAPSASATAAAAIASALASGQISGTALPTHTKVGFAAIALGAVMVVAGLLWTPLNVLILAGGGALIAWAIRTMRDATARAASRTAG